MSYSYPTKEQLVQGYEICCWLTKMYLSIHLVRLDQITERIVIIARVYLEIAIFPSGSWKYAGF